MIASKSFTTYGSARSTREVGKEVSGVKTTRLALTFFWLGAVLVLPGIPFALRDRKLRPLWVTLALVIFAVYLVVWSNAHYAAPATCLVFALVVQSLRHLRTIRSSRFAWGKALSRAA